MIAVRALEGDPFAVTAEIRLGVFAGERQLVDRGEVGFAGVGRNKMWPSAQAGC